MTIFDNALLMNALKPLEASEYAIFAWACASRLYNTLKEYNPHSEDLAIIEKESLTLLDCLKGGAFQSKLDELMNFISEKNESSDELSLYYEDAAASLAYAVRCVLNRDKREPICAAQRIFEAVGRFSMAEKKIELVGVELIAQLEKDKLVQLEITRQIRDLGELNDAKRSNNPAKGLLQFEQRSKLEYAIPVDTFVAFFES